MIGEYEKYADIFNTENIGELGMQFFTYVGHLSGDEPRFYRENAIDLIRDDLYSTIELTYADEANLNIINQIAYLDRLNDSVFERKSDDGFISYFAVEVNANVGSCAEYVKEIQHTLMRATNKHTIVLYKIEESFIIAYGYRGVGKYSSITYSDWIHDDDTADELMDNISVWGLSMRSLVRFAYEFRNAIKRESTGGMSYSTIAYQIFPDYYDQFGFSPERLPSKEEREEFVAWYRNEYDVDIDEDEFNDESLYIRKENLLEDDFEVDLDELEMRMLEAEMRGELVTTASISDDYEKIDDAEMQAAIALAAQLDDVDDPEAILKAMDELDKKASHTKADDTPEHGSSEIHSSGVDPVAIAASVVNTFTSLGGIPTIDKVNTNFTGNILAIIEAFKPQFPFALRRTKWKTTTLFFVVEELRGNYAYGYMINNGVREKNTSYPAFGEDLLWNIVEQNSSAESDVSDGWDDIEFEEQELELYKSDKYEVEFDTIRADGNSLFLSFWLVNNTSEDINIYAHNVEVDNEKIEEYMEIASIDAKGKGYHELELEDMSDDPYFDIRLRVEINTDENEAICESDILDIHISIEDEELDADVKTAPENVEFEDANDLLFEDENVLVYFQNAHVCDEGVKLIFNVENYSGETVNIWAHDVKVNDKEFETFMSIGEVESDDEQTCEILCKNLMPKYVLEFKFKVEVDDSDNNEISESNEVKVRLDYEDEMILVYTE